MKRFKNAVFSVLNVLVIAGILLFITAGLMKIGIIEVPGFLKKLFGEQTEQAEEYHDPAVDFLNETDSAVDYTYHSAKLTPENVKKLLYELEPLNRYSHDVHYSVFSDKTQMTKRVFVMKSGKSYCAFYLSGDGSIEKQIVRDETKTGIHTVSDDGIKSVTYKNGSIDFAAQIGVILNHSDFFKAADDPKYTFYLKSDDQGSVMLIEFSSEKNGYTQKQNYTLSLDYGIVTEAKCYENDRLIYELYTNSVSKNTMPGFAVPDELASFIPPEFGFNGN